LLRKTELNQDVDFLREGVGAMAQQLMEREVAQHVGAEAIYGEAVSADGHLVVSGGADGTVRLWSIRQDHHELTNTGAVAAQLAIMEGSHGHRPRRNCVGRQSPGRQWRL
jgi:hypothetical protein